MNNDEISSGFNSELCDRDVHPNIAMRLSSASLSRDLQEDILRALECRVSAVEMHELLDDLGGRMYDAVTMLGIKVGGMR